MVLCLFSPHIHYCQFKRKEKTGYKDFFKHACRKSKPLKRGKEIKLASDFSTTFHVTNQRSKPLSSTEEKKSMTQECYNLFQELI